MKDFCSRIRENLGVFGVAQKSHEISDYCKHRVSAQQVRKSLFSWQVFRVPLAPPVLITRGTGRASGTRSVAPSGTRSVAASGRAKFQKSLTALPVCGAPAKLPDGACDAPSGLRTKDRRGPMRTPAYQHGLG